MSLARRRDSCCAMHHAAFSPQQMHALLDGPLSRASTGQSKALAAPLSRHPRHPRRPHQLHCMLLSLPESLADAGFRPDHRSWAVVSLPSPTAANHAPLPATGTAEGHLTPQGQCLFHTDLLNVLAMRRRQLIDAMTADGHGRSDASIGISATRLLRFTEGRSSGAALSLLPVVPSLDDGTGQ